MGKRFGMAFLVLALGVAGRAMANNSKSFSFPALTITAQLNDDGSMTVLEQRSYRFKGRYRYAYREFPKNEAVRFSGMSVGFGDLDYRYAESGKEPESYRVTEHDDHSELRWFFNAKNTVMTFDIRYTVHGAVHRFEDGAELDFDFVSTMWKKKHRDVTVRVLPPPSLGLNQVQAWLDGPLWQEAEVQTDGSIAVYADKVKSRQGIRVAALYPESAFPALIKEAGQQRQAVLEENAALMARRAEKRQAILDRRAVIKERQVWGKWLLLAITLLGLAYWRQLYSAYGRRPEMTPDDSPVYQPNTRVRPALAAYLIGFKSVTPPALVSTLFDLADKGLLVLEETVAEQSDKARRKKPTAQWHLHRDRWADMKSGLMEYENQLLTFLFDELAGGDMLPIEMMKKKKPAMQKFFPKWCETVKKAADAMDWYDKDSQKATTRGVLAGLGVMLLAVPATLYFGYLGLTLLGSGTLLMLLSLFIGHRSESGQREYRYWKRYQKFLNKMRKDATLRDMGMSYIVQHLIYGPAMGVQPHHMEKMAVWVDGDKAAQLMPWFKLPEGMSMNVAFVPVMAAVMASTSGTVSASAGVGGGAGAGAGGAG